MPAISLDAKRWPIVVTTPPERIATDADIDEYLEAYAALLRSHPGARYVTVVDLRNYGGLSAKQRQAMNEWAARVKPTLGARCVGSALVFDSPLLRGMLTAMLWVRTKQRYETRVFAKLDDALSWAELKLRGGVTTRSGTD